jgi:hypothetical protein
MATLNKKYCELQEMIKLYEIITRPMSLREQTNSHNENG